MRRIHISFLKIESTLLLHITASVCLPVHHICAPFLLLLHNSGQRHPLIVNHQHITITLDTFFFWKLYICIHTLIHNHRFNACDNIEQEGSLKLHKQYESKNIDSKKDNITKVFKIYT